MRGRRGSALVACLLLSVVLVMMGQSMLSRRLSQYRWATSALLACQARSLAEAGLADARAKLEKDPLFPPPNSDEQVLFSYWEQVRDGTGQPVGAYKVEVDSSHAGHPYFILIVRATGYVGPTPDPLAVRTITAEWDLAPTDRLDANRANPHYYRYVNWTVGR